MNANRTILDLRSFAFIRGLIKRSFEMFLSEEFRLKVGLAEMLKGGVIMDVTNVGAGPDRGKGRARRR